MISRVGQRGKRARDRDGPELCGGIKRGVARREKRAKRGPLWRKGRENGGEPGRTSERGTKREMRGKAAGEKGREIKGERERERKRGRRKRARVEAAGFLFRHRRSHPTKIDSVSLGSSVQRRATRRNLLCPSLLVHSCSGRDRRQRLSSFLSSLSRFLFFLARFSPRCRIPLSSTLFVSQERKGEKGRESERKGRR